MKTSGSIIALISGLLGLFAAGVTILVAIDDESEIFFALGSAGVVTSMIVIIFSVYARTATSRKPGILIILASILGILFGGPIVAIFMFLALIGGILITISFRRSSHPSTPTATSVPRPEATSAATPAATPAATSAATPAATSAATPTPHPSPATNPPTEDSLPWYRKPLGTRDTVLGLAVAISFIIIFSNHDERWSDAPPQERIAVGETFRTPKFEMKIVSTGKATSLGSLLFSTQPAAGGVYIVVTYSYTNISSKPISASQDPSVSLRTPEGAKYEFDLNATIAHALLRQSNKKVLSDINPGLQFTEAVVFEVSSALFNPESWLIEVQADETRKINFY